MQLDVEDVLAGVFGSIVGRWLSFIVAVWSGCLIGVGGMIVGRMIDGGSWFPLHGLGAIVAAPTFLLSMWGVMNVPFLLFSFIYFLRSELLGYRAWGVVIGVESLTVMAGYAKHGGQSGMALVASWLAWAVLLVMVETGLWLMAQISRNRWARQLEELRAENQQSHAERDAKEQPTTSE